MTVVTGNKFGYEIAELLGLKKTRNITISMPFDCVVQVEVEALLTEEDGKKLTGFFQKSRYKLVLIDEDEPVNLRGDYKADMCRFPFLQDESCNLKMGHEGEHEHRNYVDVTKMGDTTREFIV